MEPTATEAMPAMPGGNTEDAMTDKLSAAMSTDSGTSQTDQTDTGATQDTAQQTEDQTADTGTSDQTADATAPADAAPDTDLDPYADDQEGDQATIDGFLKTQRGREIYAGHKFVRELA